MSEMPRHILHVGYPKAGATFLKSWSLAHPQVHFAHGGIGGFTSIEEVHQRQDEIPPDVRCYVTSSEQLVAVRDESAVAVHDIDQAAHAIVRQQEQTCRTLSTLFRGCQVLILTRGYLGMTRSSHSQYLKEGGWEWKLDESSLAYMAGLWVHYLDYARVTALYEEHFGRENVHVLPYELLRDDRKEFLRALEAVAGADPLDFDPGRLNPSLSPEEQYWYPRISKTVGSIAGHLPGRLGARLRNVYRERLALTGGLRPVVRVLERIHSSGTRSENDVLGPEMIRQAFGGLADSLAERPYFDRFTQEYAMSTRSRSAPSRKMSTSK